MVPVTIVLLLFAGLVVDGGTALAAQGHALDVAQQAARAGANAITPASLRTGGQVHLRIDPAGAQTAARQVLTAGGATGTITVDADVVTVTAHVPARTVILNAIGIQDASGQATASATPVHGIGTAGIGP
jgi:Flp pilus assembly protein TadG